MEARVTSRAKARQRALQSLRRVGGYVEKRQHDRLSHDDLLATRS